MCWIDNQVSDNIWRLRRQNELPGWLEISVGYYYQSAHALCYACKYGFRGTTFCFHMRSMIISLDQDTKSTEEKLVRGKYIAISREYSHLIRIFGWVLRINRKNCS